jgi:hypothetical protein
MDTMKIPCPNPKCPYGKDGMCIRIPCVHEPGAAVFTSGMFIEMESDVECILPISKVKQNGE